MKHYILAATLALSSTFAMADDANPSADYKPEHKPALCRAQKAFEEGQKLKQELYDSCLKSGVKHGTQRQQESACIQQARFELQFNRGHHNYIPFYINKELPNSPYSIFDMMMIQDTHLVNECK